MNWHSLNSLRLLIPLVFGILCGEFLDKNAPFLWLALPVGIGLLAWFHLKKSGFQTRWLFGLAAQILLFLFAWQRTILNDERASPAHFSKMETGSDDRFFIARLDEPPARTARKWKARMVVEAVGTTPDSLQKADGNLLVYFDTTAFSPGEFGYGDLLLIHGKMQPTQPPANPNSFNFKRYLHFQNVHYQCFVSKKAVRRLAQNQGSFIWKIAFASRNRFLEILKKYFPTADEFAVASALLVGYKTDLSDELKNAYVETGSMHALAVSGMHVGGIYLALGFFFRRMKRGSYARRWLEPAVSLAVIWAFAFITGASASVLRAAVMFSAMLLAKVLRRDQNIWNTLAISAFWLLLWNPFLLFDAGFQLSYLAVAGIVFFGNRWQSLVFPLRGLGWAWETLVMGFAAQLATLPVSLLYFHQFPTYFWLSGLLVVPLGMVVLWGGMGLFLLEMVWPPAAWLLGKCLFGLVWAMNQGIFIIQKLPGSLVEGIFISGLTAALLYMVLIFGAGWWILRRPAWLIAAFGGLLFMSAERANTLVFNGLQRKVVVYNLSKKSLVDFIDGKKLVSLSDSLTEKELDWSASANRLADGMENQQTFFWKSSPDFQAENLFVRGPFVQFFEHKMAVIDHSHWLKNASNVPPVAVDFLLIRGNPFLKIADAVEQFPCSRVIFDGSNSFSKVEKWKVECADLALDFHDVRADGAFVFEW